MRNILFFLLLGFLSVGNAQYVIITDNNFSYALNKQIPQCMIGGYLDTTCSETITKLDVSSSSIQSIKGIEYFANLDTLICANNRLTSIPNLPKTLSYLDCSHNNITGSLIFGWDYFPGFSYLNCSYNSIGPELSVSHGVQYLTANNNQLTTVNAATGKGKLDLRNNLITSDKLPNLCYVDTLYLSNNKITSCFEVSYRNIYVDDPCVICPKVNIHGRVWEDINKNAVYDQGEDLGGWLWEYKVKSSNGDRIFTASPLPLGGWYDISFSKQQEGQLSENQEPDTALYYLTGSTLLWSYYEFVSQTMQVNNCVRSYDFNIDQKVIPSRPIDAKVSLSVSGTTRPAGTFGHLVEIYDNTSITNVGGKIAIKFDKRLEVIGVWHQANEFPIVSQNDSVVFFSYKGKYGGPMSLYFDFHVPDSLLLDLGDSLFTTATIYPDYIKGDRDTTNNSFTYGLPLNMSYDPNEKAVFPPSNISPKFISERQNLTYTILFQNIGNAEAINIRIQDTLSQNLDISSLDVYETSHNGYTFDSNNNIATWTFKNINLPDSASNQAASHGFIKYRIKPKATLKTGDEIRNTASIYFDFNPAVVTNTTITKIIDPIVTELETLDSEFETIKVFPNPSKEFLNIRVDEVMTNTHFELLEISGQSVLKQAIKNNQTQLDISELKAGTYLYRFTTNDGVKFGKVVKQ